MGEAVVGSEYHSLHHFLSDSPWDPRPVLKQIAHDIDRLFSAGSDVGLILDESAFVKKGASSVGVARQWCGRLGKVENCQVGVFAALARGSQVGLFDARLYLPQTWTQDPKRCERAGVPAEEIRYRSKSALALDMVQQARGNAIRFQWVGADAGYGKEPAFLRGLEDANELFLVDVHKDQRIYLEDPQPRVPPATGKKGRPFTCLTTDVEPIRVDEWAKARPAADWQWVTVRHSTQGPLRVQVLHRRVWLWDGQEAQARHWHLVVRRETGDVSRLKYSLSNAASDTSIGQLAHWQAQRFWIERAFEDAKSEVGMADYQVRGWQGWHHHIVMSLLAMLFILETKAKHREVPLLSPADIRRLLEHFLPRKNASTEEILLQMHRRHRQRLSASESACRSRAAPPKRPADNLSK
jgi:SRSO17 transposase